MKQFLLMLIIGAFISVGLNAQEVENRFTTDFAIGPEFQAYPTGLTPGIVAYKYIGNKNYLHAKAGYNYVRHGDAGIQEDERGGGFGGSLGFNRMVNVSDLQWLAGIRCDLWFNSLDWKNKIGQPDEVSGTTDIVVVQPTASIGYPIPVGKGFFLPQVSFGVEVNVKTEGEETGEGLVLLVGVSYLFD